MNYCTFDATDDPGVHVCRRCKVPMPSPSPPERTGRYCTLPGEEAGQPNISIGCCGNIIPPPVTVATASDAVTIQQMPSAPRVAWNALSALGRVVAAALAGEQVTLPIEEVQDRLDTCAACDQLQDGRCRGCGCFVEAKARLDTEHCPLAKWAGD